MYYGLIVIGWGRVEVDDIYRSLKGEIFGEYLKTNFYVLPSSSKALQLWQGDTAIVSSGATGIPVNTTSTEVGSRAPPIKKHNVWMICLTSPPTLSPPLIWEQLHRCVLCTHSNVLRNNRTHDIIEPITFPT